MKTVLIGAIFFLVLTSSISSSFVFAQNLAMGQNEPVYCPETVEKKYCYKVIIIGAGMAGLGAANELKSHGYDVIILEAGTKPGGRVVTTHFLIPPIPFDLHASWISGENGNPITELAQNYGSDLLPTGEDGSYYDDDGIISNTQRLANLKDATLYYDFKTWLDTYRHDKTADEPLQNAIDKFIVEKNLNEADTQDFLFEISSYIGTEYAYDPINMSLLYWDKTGYKVGGEESNDVVFLDGYDKIPNGLANDLGNDSIQYKTSVKHISYSEQGVKVDTNQKTYYSKYAISTIPINLLQQNTIIQFTPPLPQNKTDAINKMQMGTLAQTYINFTNGVFWDKDADYLYYIPTRAETGHWVAFLNMYKINGQPMLMAFNYGNYALQVVMEGDYKIRKDLSNIFGNMTDSSFDMNSIQIIYKGEPDSYSTNPIGFKVPNDYDMLASPVADSNGTNRVFFAGEATTWHYPATTHGAFLSGLREANRVMVTDTGEYPSPHEQEKNWRYPTRSDNESPWLTFPEYVMCKPGLNLIAKASNNTAACVFENHMDKLVSYGWAKDYTQP